MLTKISDDTDVLRMMSIVVISDEQKAAVGGLTQRETAVCLEPGSSVKIISH